MRTRRIRRGTRRGVASSARRDWLEQSVERKARWQHEKKWMQRHFSKFRYQFDETGKPFWTGPIHSSFSEKTFRIKVVYPENFPASAPMVYLLDNLNTQGYHHIYSNGQLCFNVRASHAKALTDEAVMSAAVLLHDFDVYLKTGRSYL